MIPKWYVREIRAGMAGPDVKTCKRILGLDWETPWDGTAQVLLRGYFGRDYVTADIAEKIGESEAAAEGLPPEWYVRDLEPGMWGPDVDAVRKILDLGHGIYDDHMESAVRRYQSNHQIVPTGTINEELSLLLGEAE